MEADIFSSPNKRQKTQSPPSSLKGKQKIDEEETKHESPDHQVCGICFEGKAIRGWIDSCDHHFCFVCIMEWSKVESRCPLCKQRFKTICRKPQVGVFFHERVVNVPVRNQVWHPLGNQTTTENSDPYAEVKCVKCQSSSDDHLLLLCDLCDLAAHTFCVGLGYTVPEGDWYCEDCTAVKNEHSDGETDPACQYSTTSFRTIEVENNPRDLSYGIATDDSDTDYLDSNSSISAPNVSVSDIIRQSRPRPRIRISNRSTGRTSRCQNDLSSHRPDRGIVSDSAGTDSSARGIISDSAGTDSSARTLGHCRNVRNRIQLLRQNWDAFRNGSLVFSNLSNSDAKDKKRRGREEIYDRSSEAQPSSSMNCNKKTTKDNASGVKVEKKGRYDVDKAWQMLDIANSVQRARKCTQSSHPISNHQPGERNVSKAANIARSTLSMSRSRSFQPGPSQSFHSLSKEACLADQDTKLVQRGHQSSPHDSSHRVGKQANNTGLAASISTRKKSQPEDLRKLELETNSWHQCLELEEQKLKSDPRRISLDTLRTSSCLRPPSVHPSQSSELSFAIPAHILDQDDLFERRKSDEKSVSLNLSESRSNIRSASHIESLCRGSELSQNRLESCASSVLKEKQSKESGTDRSCAKVLLKKDNDAKCEIQSLVKLNLKLLNRDKQLGVDGFKEVARLATHTILAACGLEHKESSVRPFPNTICRHNDRTKHLHMSNLMPSACRECFYGFVKDVVSSIMAEG